jgi:hypothetical protein
VSAQAARGGRTAARARTAAGVKARPVAPFAPLSFGKRATPAEADRIPLFEIDGTEYTIPAVVPTGDALVHLLNVNAMDSEAQRGVYLIRELAGPEALTALLGEADMTDGDWHKLITILSEHAFGRLEASSGN